MIKTHKPRGQQWTHASEFQQAKGFRDINLDECEAISEGEGHVKASDRKAASSARVAKRQRIEKLASDFLDGTPLFISSARPSPQLLRSVVFRTTRDYARPARTLLSASECLPSSASLAQCEDVEDEDETLERLASQLRRTSAPHMTNKPQSASGLSPTLRAQAKCRPIRRSRTINITTDPSIEALQQAAALRTQKSKRSNSEISVLHRQAFSKTLMANTSPEPRTAPPSGSRRVADAVSSGRWLSRRRSRFSFSKYIPDDDSLDELRSTPDDYQEAALIESEAKLNRQAKDHFYTNSSNDKVSYRTAQEQNATDSGIDDMGQSDSTQELSSGRNELDTPSLPLLSASAAMNLEHHQSPPSRRTRSRTTKSSTKSGSKPKSGYITAQSSQANSTPFMFRKRHSTLHDPGRDQEVTPASSANRDMRRLSHPLGEPIISDDIQLATAGVAASKSDKPTRIYASSNRDMHPANSPPLQSEADERESTKHDSSSHGEENLAVQYVSPKNALGNSLLASQALSPDDTPEASDSTLQADSQAWAGTQFLLNEAQQDLFTSPEKKATVLDKRDQQTPQHNNETPRARESSSKREPLAQLSQEPLPSTQQLLGNFEGWSTVKKPRAGIRGSLLPTPSGKGIASQLDNTPMTTRATSSAPITKHTSVQKTRAQSHLCQSFSSTARATADPLDNVAASGTMREELKQSQTLAPSDGTGDEEPSVLFTVPPAAEYDVSTMQDATGGGELSAASLTSFEMAQKMPQLLREMSNLSETIDDLRNMLDMSDMQDVLSQVE